MLGVCDEGFREMTRYSNPLPHNPVPPNQVPHSQGRPAGQSPQPAHAHMPHMDHEQPAWPSQGVPRTGRPAAQQPYADQGYQPEYPAPAPQDPYAALRPDGYGYSQPAPAADPYGLAGYSAPQPSAPSQGYGARPPQQQAPSPMPQPSYEPYSAAADPYGANGGYGYAGQSNLQAPPPFGAAQPHAQPAPSAPAFGSSGHSYAQPAAPQPQTSPYGGGYAAPQTNSYAPPRAEAPLNPLADQWGAQSLALDARDYDGHAYSAGGLNNALQQGAAGQWGGDPYGEPQMEPDLGGQVYQNNAQQPHASFDQSYAEDDAQYEEEPRRSSWKKVVALVACTVAVGGVLTFAYSSIMGPSNNGPTPLVKGATGPTKVKPSEPGGKQFAHTDSKIMGRLGEGAEPEADGAGVRKVPVVVVGRDGSIQPPPAAQPAAPQDEQTRAVVAVPGLTVIDGLGGAPAGGPSPNRPVTPRTQPQQQASPPVQMVTASDTDQPVVVAPSQQAPKKAANLIANAAPSETGAVQTKAVATPKAEQAAPAPKKEKVAAVAAPAAVSPQPTGAGYVAVLASVPASGSSRIDALKQFADMQQKYGTILSNKTPDVQEANLGTKGTYHRLLVGPPGSRDSANSVCAQLKAEGYSGCWVTAY